MAVSAARARLGRLATAIEAEGVAAATVLLEGAPAEQIVGFVAGNDIDLVALGSHGAWGDDGGLHGSVADAIIRQSPVPTLVRRVPAYQPMSSAVPFQRLLVPLDGSPLAERAVPYAVELAKATGGRVLLVQAVADVRSFSDGGSATLIAREFHAAGGYLTSLRERYRSACVPLDITVRLGRSGGNHPLGRPRNGRRPGGDGDPRALRAATERMGSVALTVLQGSVPLLLLGSSVTTATETARRPAAATSRRCGRHLIRPNERTEAFSREEPNRMTQPQRPVALYYDAASPDITTMQAGLPDVTIFPVATPLQSGGPLPEEARPAEILSIGLASRVEWATLQQFPACGCWPCAPTA